SLYSSDPLMISIVGWSFNEDSLNPPCLIQLFYFLSACQAANNSFSRSGVMPALNLACLSAGCFLNQSSVARAVSDTGLNVNPLSSARLMLIKANPAESPTGGTHTGISDQG